MILLTDSAYELVNFRKMSNTCERVINVLPGEWLPYYYGAYALIQMSFLSDDDREKDLYCERALVYIDTAMQIVPDQSELQVLKAMLFFAMMEVNQMIRGPIYLPKAMEALKTAETLDPGNPRIYLLSGRSIFYTPEFLGGGREAALPVLENAILLFREFVPATSLHPDWGESSALEVYRQCLAAEK